MIVRADYSAAISRRPLWLITQMINPQACSRRKACFTRGDISIQRWPYRSSTARNSASESACAASLGLPALLEGVAMGAGYGLIPSTQAQPLVDSGRLQDLCPNHCVMVDLYWHHWELEPPLAHDVTALIVKVAHRELVSRAVDTRMVVVAESGDLATRLRHVNPVVAGHNAKADCNTQ